MGKKSEYQQRGHGICCLTLGYEAYLTERVAGTTGYKYKQFIVIINPAKQRNMLFLNTDYRAR